MPKPTPSRQNTSLPDAVLERFEVLEARLAALEASSSTAPKQSAKAKLGALAQDETYWALNGLSERAPEGGAVLYTGDVFIPGGGRVVWQRQADAKALFSSVWADLADTIAALGHPVRLGVLQACMGEQRSTQELLELPQIGTSGQLFHHLKTLQQAGWLRSTQRGHYQVPADRVVPLLAVLTASRG